jgi:hypothetical protein
MTTNILGIEEDRAQELYSAMYTELEKTGKARFREAMVYIRDAP